MKRKGKSKTIHLPVLMQISLITLSNNSFSCIVGRRRTALGGATTRPARNSAENCERANISKTLTTTLTTSSETSTTSAELGTRQKMLPERRKRNPPPQVATTQRALEHHLVLLRRRNQVQAKIILLFREAVKNYLVDFFR